MKNELIHSLYHSLYEWGVNGDQRAHSDFRKNIIGAGLIMYHEKYHEKAHSSTFEHLKHTALAFPTNYEDAIRRALQDPLEKKKGKTGFFDDRCVTREPYYRWYGKQNSSITDYRLKPSITDYQLKPDYKGWSKKQLDPVHL